MLKHFSLSYRKHKFPQMSRGFLDLDFKYALFCVTDEVFQLEIHETGRLSYIISEMTRLKTISI